MMKFGPTTALMLAAAALTGLAGCRVKQDEEQEPVAQQPTETASAEPEETAAASIIRPDVVSEPVIDVPPESLAITVPFPQGGYELNEKAKRILDGVLTSDALKEGWPIILRGHTDSAGTDSGNLIASEKRAETVAAWLVDNGVGQERIKIIALGEQRPLAPNAHLDGTPDEEGRARNRRVQIWIAPAGKKQPEASGEAAGDAAPEPAAGE